MKAAKKKGRELAVLVRRCLGSKSLPEFCV